MQLVFHSVIFCDIPQYVAILHGPPYVTILPFTMLCNYKVNGHFAQPNIRFQSKKIPVQLLKIFKLLAFTTNL